MRNSLTLTVHRRSCNVEVIGKVFEFPDLDTALRFIDEHGKFWLSIIANGITTDSELQSKQRYWMRKYLYYEKGGKAKKINIEGYIPTKFCNSHALKRHFYKFADLRMNFDNANQALTHYSVVGEDEKISMSWVAGLLQTLVDCQAVITNNLQPFYPTCVTIASNEGNIFCTIPTSASAHSNLQPVSV